MSALIRGLVGALVLVTATPAWADGVRYDACSNLGESCHNAIPGHHAEDPDGGRSPDEATASGKCEEAKCERGGPDGPIIFDCRRCIAGESDDGGCSCRTVQVRSPRSLAGVMMLVGAAAIAWSRRRRS